MALELFKPFLFKVLEEKGEVTNIKQARKMLDRQRDIKESVWDALEEVIEDKVVLLNRAPTLHRLGIQAFEPILVEGQSIQLHPLVCEAFNADFDGDQMAIHVPLSAQAQAEARIQMLSSHNLLSPAHGEPNVKPSRDIILGIFTLTQLRVDREGTGRKFSSKQKVLDAFDKGEIRLNSPILLEGVETSAGRIRYNFGSVEEALLAVERGTIDHQDQVTVRINGEMVQTSAGRVRFYRFVQETLEADGTRLEKGFLDLNTTYEKNALQELVLKSFKKLGIEKTARLLDTLKDEGFKLSTTSGVTIGIDDVVIPPQKTEIIERADRMLEKIEANAEMGFLTPEERYKQVVQLWNDCTDEVRNAVFDNFSKNYPFNPLWIMSQSGARGNPQQIRQLAGMRGLMAKPDGSTIEVPIKASFREGLDVLEYFISTHGARKGGADTALRTADSGYLTRKLCDVSHEVVVRDLDCFTTEYSEIGLGAFDEKTGAWKTTKASEIETSLYGRNLAMDLEMGSTGRILEAGSFLALEDVRELAKIADQVQSVFVRTPMDCKIKAGVCQKCYGYDLSQAKPVSLGEAVGIIAAESIGEPGTQLTMRTFHTGGVAGGSDITLGLPRVIELFEARKPKVKAVLADRDGTLRIVEEEERNLIRIEADEEGFSSKTATKVEKSQRLLKKDGERVEAGEVLTRGAISPHELLEIKGIRETQKYLVDEVQRVYRSQGVKVHDKHIELIVRQMLKWVEIVDGGETRLLEGQTVERFEVDIANANILAEGKKEATWKPLILGITKSSLTTRSWLSAASFQHTTHVLTEASIGGRVDELIGLKENVILGKLIPAGTGLAIVRESQIADPRTLERYGTGNAPAVVPARAPAPVGEQPAATD